MRSRAEKRGLLQVARLVKLPGPLHRGELVEVRLVLAAVSASTIASACHKAGVTSAASAVLRLRAGVRTGRAAPAPLSGGPGAPQARPSSESPPCRWTRAAAALDARHAPGRRPRVAAVPSRGGTARWWQAVKEGRTCTACTLLTGCGVHATLKGSARCVADAGRRSRTWRRPQGLLAQ